MAFTFVRKGGAPRPTGQARGGRWGAGLLNVGLVLLVWAGGSLPLFFGGVQLHTGLAEGQRAPSTVVSTVVFECEDVAMTALKRHQATDLTPPFFHISEEALTSALRAQMKLCDRVLLLRQAGPMAAVEGAEGAAAGETPAAAKRQHEAQMAKDLGEVADLLGIPMGGEDILAVFPAGKEKVALAILQHTLTAVWDDGILTAEERDTGFQGVAPNLTLTLHPRKGTNRVMEVTAMQESQEAMDRFAHTAQDALSAAGVDVPVKDLRALVEPWFGSNLVYDPRQTLALRTAAARAVEPILMTVRAGTTLMEEREVVSAQTIEMLNAYYRRLYEVEPPLDRRVRQIGRSLLMLLVLCMCLAWEWIASRQMRAAGPVGVRRKSLLAILGLLAVGFSGLYFMLCLRWAIIPPWLAAYAIPMATVAILGSLLLGPSPGLACALWMAISADLIFGRGFEMVPAGVGASVVAILMLRRVRKRSQVFRAGLTAGLAVGLVAVALSIVQKQLPPILLAQIGTAILSGVISAILAMLLLPVLEWVSKYTTDITLLELTDVGHPLLRRLAMEAPGTYHHSLMVGVLGQAAADAIGANGLQIAVCANFHDIGKLAKPEFFTENQRGGENPHDSLAPAMSTLIIQSHVREGITLAQRYKLPEVIVRGIATHHGTSLTSYFYQVALRELKEAGLPEDPGLEHSYRYPGPRPQTREEAILMLADTVEAASRSLERPTPKNISDLVDRLTAEKMKDEQLSESPLTLDEFRRVREALRFTLNNILHGRNPYPTKAPDPKQAVRAAVEPPRAPEADPEAREVDFSG